MKEIKTFIEAGKKKTFAGAVDWPGWCRSGKDENTALQSLMEYGPRYAQVLAGSASGFQLPGKIAQYQIIERQPGSATTDFGAPDAILASDPAELSQAELEFFQEVLQACWRAFDQAVLSAREKELRKGPRGGGRDLEKILTHVLDGDHAYLRRLAWKFRRDPEATPQSELVRIRQAIMGALHAARQGELPAQGPRGGVVWPPRFFVRRVAWHTLDHAWEIEDRLED